MAERKTPLYSLHTQLGGRMVPYGGWLLPVQYSGILPEHGAVRGAAGLFDVSHMGRFALEGGGATAWLESMLTNRVEDAQPGQAVYSPVCIESGGTLDDIIAYRKGGEAWLLVVNAANREKDFAHFRRYLREGLSLLDISDELGQLAIQGPKAGQIMQQVLGADLSSVRNYHFVQIEKEDVSYLVSRTGYTGEDGFEVYLPAAASEEFARQLLEAGAPHGLLPCGLGARDLLRFEAAMPLYGHELSDKITPLEANLSRFVKMDKPDFIGKDALALPRKRKRIGLAMVDRGIAREHYPVYQGGSLVGHVTSGSMSPSCGGNLAMALVDVSVSEDEDFFVEIRGKLLRARRRMMPFYKRPKIEK